MYERGWNHVRRPCSRVAMNVYPRWASLNEAMTLGMAHRRANTATTNITWQKQFHTHLTPQRHVRDGLLVVAVFAAVLNFIDVGKLALLNLVYSTSPTLPPHIIEAIRQGPSTPWAIPTRRRILFWARQLNNENFCPRSIFSFWISRGGAGRPRKT